MNNDQKNNGLKLLNDSVFNPQTEQDAFNHVVYAKLLAKIFSPAANNDPGISVALFGKWGQGKSSVVEMLKKELTEEKVKVILFNAWQARGDSVRRQLFLEVLGVIHPAEATKMKRFSGLEVTRELLQTEDERNHSKKQARLNLLKSMREDNLLGWSFVALLALLIFPVYNFATFFIRGIQINWASTITQTVIFPALFFLFKYVRETVISKYTGLLGISEPISESQRLKYPEQFKDLFVKHAAIFSEEQDQELLVVVDDLDRCEPETVVEALASIRQLGGNQKYTPKDGGKHQGKDLPMRCRFLIPCDEKQVVLALETDGYFAGKNGASYHDYQSEELLRKFFDVVVRMDAFVPEDMVSYAGKMLRATGNFPEDDIGLVQELIGAVAPHDPRQVKKLVNAYLISKEKIRAAQESKALRSKEKLDHFDKTILAVIALQETVPTIFEKLVESPQNEFERLRKVIGNPAKQDELDTRAASIIRALDPVSYHTFSLLTRKGIPETLAAIDNGPDIYDAIRSGNEETFTEEIAKSGDLATVVTWLKEYRKSAHNSIAQFRNALICLLHPETASETLYDVIADYINEYPRIKEAFAGFEKLLVLAQKTINFESRSKRRVHTTIIENLCVLPDEQICKSEELKAIFIFGNDLSETETTRTKEKITPLFRIREDTKILEQRLSLLKEALPKNYNGTMPELALTITRDCTWSIYNTSEPDKNKGLHSDLIVAFIGEDAVTTAMIVDLLFKPKGPLEIVINLKSTSSQKGEREALRTLACIAKNLLPADVSKLYEKLIQWVNAQNDMGDFTFVCDILRSVWTRLSEAQIDAFANLLTDRCSNAKDAEWLCSFVESEDCKSDTETQKFTRFCKQVLTRLNALKLTNNNFDETTKALLKGMATSKWPIAEAADTHFETAIRSKIRDKSAWDLWATEFWPIIEQHHPLTERAVYDKIQSNFLPDTLIPFAVTTICSNALTSSLQITLKQFFCTHPGAVNSSAFRTVLNAKDVKGVDEIVNLIVEDLDAAKAQLDEPRVEFLVKNLSSAKQETRHLLLKHIRIHYLQDGNQTTFLKGVDYVSCIGNPTADVTSRIKERAKEMGSTLTDVQRQTVTGVLGEDVFRKAQPDSK